MPITQYQQLEQRYRHVCQERDRWKALAEERGSQIREFEAFLTCPNLSGEKIRRTYAVVKAMRNAPPDPERDGWVNPDLKDVVDAGGIKTASADESKAAKKRAFKNAMSNASRYMGVAEELGIIERDEPEYLREDKQDPYKITGSVIRACFTVPPERALYAAARAADPKPANKTRGRHVPIPRCPKCGSQHTRVSCDSCGWKGTGKEWAELEADRQEATAVEVQTLQPDSEAVIDLQKVQTSRSICLQNMQPDSPQVEVVNHSPQGESHSGSTLLTDDLPEELKVFQRVNGARDRLGTAIAYARASSKVFPCHAPTVDGCTCGKVNCTDAGKHPRTPCGVHDATTNEDTIKRWWRQWPQANIGISTDGLVVIDPDAPEPGKPDGLAAWQEFAASHDIPATLTARTGSGGKHLVYRAPEGVKIGNSCKGLAEGVHVRGAGGYIIVAPSVHESGEQYTWTEIRPIAPLADALLHILVPPEPDPAPLRPVAIPETIRIWRDGRPLHEGERNTELFRVASAWRGKYGLSEEEITGYLLEANRLRCVDPLPECDVVKIAHSAAKYPAGVCL